MRYRTTVAVIGLIALAVMPGCSATPSDSWHLRPLSLSRAADVVPATASDLFVPVSLAADAAGGVWATSGSTWTHIDAAGDVDRQFSYEPFEPPWVIGAVDVVTPTQLIAGRTWSDGGYFGDLVLIDTVTLTTTELSHTEQAVGDLVVTGREVVFVSYKQGETDTFVLRAANLDDGSVRDVVSVRGDGATASIADDPAGNVYVATREAVYSLSPDAEAVETLVTYVSPAPQVVASSSGTLAWVAMPGAQEETSYVIDGGSSRAREIIEAQAGCDTSRLMIGRPNAEVSLGALCNPSSMAWLSDGRLVVSVGSEGGAPIVVVAPPDL
ncbi:hypothetical protein SK224_01420 [Microbacterium sp. BG28]|nr:hypothetical protein [Microbacterium sp. BG28]